ncbi:MAG: RDD family protein [Acidimicrobiia bacterium]
MANLYEILGVERGSNKDEIRAAYRAKSATSAGPERMQLNKAWNVLSDDYQRGRYDSDLESGVAEDFAAPEGVAAAPASRGRDARGGSKAEARQRSMEARMEAMKKRFPPIPLPAGYEQAQPKARGIAFAIDAFIVFLFLVAIAPLSANLATAKTPAEEAKSKGYECVQYVGNTEIAYVDKKKPDVVAKLDKQCASSLRSLDQNSLKSLSAAEGKKTKDAAKKRVNNAAEANAKLTPPLNSSQYGALIGGAFLILLVLVLPALKNGQTIGKRVKGIMLRTTSGEVPRRSTLLRRYGLAPVAVIGLLLIPLFGPLVMITLMFIGTNWSNNPNLQSTLDRWAGTLVLAPTEQQ